MTDQKDAVKGDEIPNATHSTIRHTKVHRDPITIDTKASSNTRSQSKATDSEEGRLDQLLRDYGVCVYYHILPSTHQADRLSQHGLRRPTPTTLTTGPHPENFLWVRFYPSVS